MKTHKTVILHNVKNAKDWDVDERILEDREIVFVRENGMFKIGDGKKTFSELPFLKKESYGESLQRTITRTNS